MHWHSINCYLLFNSRHWHFIHASNMLRRFLLYSTFNFQRQPLLSNTVSLFEFQKLLIRRGRFQATSLCLHTTDAHERSHHTRTHLIPCILLKTFATNSAVINITPHSTAWNLHEIYFTLTLCACSRDWKLSELCLSILSRLMCLRCENAEIPTLLTVL